MLELTKSPVSVYIFQDGWSVRRNRTREDLKVFIDVNVETVTNAELLLDNKICHASFTNLQIAVMYCLHYAVLDIILLLSVFASENIRKT